MDLSFALLMIVSCILGVWALIATERNMSYERNLKELQENQVSATPDAGKYSAALTPELIAEAVRANGYVPAITEQAVDFMILGESYSVMTDRLPVVTLFKGYTLDKTKYDMDLLKQAFHRLSDDMIMVKAFVNDDDETVSFRVIALEYCFGNFCASLGRSIDIINEAVELSKAIYHQLEEAQNKCAGTGFLSEKMSAPGANFS